ncbi:AHH domain-containing protein [Psychromonas aquimarina]|uniref:AHH domain-containing protein n=1 Tax=Psychromonas aquimarina TaxID=444919 RepID=UPI00041CA2FD|nr:AHH domain-containing protein [Psychromonas aquimarina]
MLQNQAYPHPTRPADPSVMEMAIYNFELKAKAFHDQRLKNSTGENNKELLDKMKRDYEHLQHEKRRISAHVILQNDLEAYRDECSKSTVKKLRNEDHHPTAKLAANLTAVGEPKPTTMHEPHHIICGKGRFQQANMKLARLNLHSHGIGINDPYNGAWLINYLKNKDQDWATADAPAHRQIHRYNYETWIATNFTDDTLDRSRFINRLNNIKVLIKTSNFPAQVLGVKDELWKGF